MYEIIGKGTNGDVMVLDYEDYAIDRLTAEELQQAVNMGLKIQERNPVSLDTFDFSPSSLGMMAAGKNMHLIKLFEKNNDGVTFAFIHKDGYFAPSVAFSLRDENGNLLHQELKIVTIQVGYRIGNYCFFRLDLGCEVPALLYIQAYGNTPIATKMKQKASVWSKYFVSIPGVIDLDTLQYRYIPVGDDKTIGYKSNNYKLAKSSTGAVHIVDTFENKSKFNVSKFLGL